MRRHEKTAKRNCAARADGVFAAGATSQIAMRRNRGAIVRALYVSG